MISALSWLSSTTRMVGRRVSVMVMSAHVQNGRLWQVTSHPRTRRVPGIGWMQNEPPKPGRLVRPAAAASVSAGSRSRHGAKTTRRPGERQADDIVVAEHCRYPQSQLRCELQIPANVERDVHFGVALVREGDVVERHARMNVRG